MPSTRFSNVLLLACCFLFTAHICVAGEIVATELTLNSVKAKGSEFAPQVLEINRHIKSKEFSIAEEKAIAVTKSFQAIFDVSKKQYTFQTQDEFNEFKRSSNDNFEWIDWGYKEALQAQAFIASERKAYSEALTILHRIETLAPMSAGPLVEMGYILNQTGQPAKGLENYRRAYELTNRYQSQKPYRALALRGMGFALIDLKQLDLAEKNFVESLEIEPGNKLALGELDYIRGLRSK